MAGKLAEETSFRQTYERSNDEQTLSVTHGRALGESLLERIIVEHHRYHYEYSRSTPGVVLLNLNKCALCKFFSPDHLRIPMPI